MKMLKIKDSLIIIENHSGNIQRYLQNGGSNQSVIYQELDSINNEISILKKEINILKNIN